MSLLPNPPPSPTNAPSTLPENLPAAQSVADVVALRRGCEVRLPPRFAKAAVEAWLATYKAVADVVEGPCGPELTVRPLGEGEWAIRIARCAWDFKLMPRSVQRQGDHVVYIFPKHVVVLATSPSLLLRAIEKVKPEELDADGRPLPWVPPRHRTESLAATTGEDDDAVLLADGEELPPIDADAVPGATRPVSDADIRSWFEKLSRLAGFGSIPLSLARGGEDKLGITTGRVWFRADFVPVRVHLTTCPNSDLAEVLATIVHELAHPMSRTRAHGDAFKAALVSLAERAWGSRWFVEARHRLGQEYRAVDAWVTTGIRAALRGADAPVARAGDDGQMARVVTKIRKLRELAANQLGLPEAIAASATANDLVTTYELGSYAIRIDAGIQEQMVDRWVPLEEGAVWRRDLAHGVAHATDVFSLALAKQSRMHFFGRYADVVQAEYLFTISEARIRRECERHLEAWRAKRGQIRPGDTVRERVSFCDSAVRAFRLKLEQIVREEGESVSGRRQAAPKSAALEAAEEFARVEHDKRGSGWRSGGGRAIRDNAAGRELGQSLEVVRGLTSTGEAPKGLPPRR